MKRRSFFSLIMVGWLASTSSKLINFIITQSQTQPKEKPVSKDSKKYVFYVATTGNNNWSGTLENPNEDQTDGPFATLIQARNTIRELKQKGNLQQEVIVFIRGGTYFLNETLVFNAIDSGTNNFPITYAAYKDEEPIVSGGRMISGWQEEVVNNATLWVTQIPEVKEGSWYFRQLWVNGQRRNRTRYPNKGYLKVVGVPDVTPETPWHKGQKRFNYLPGDLRAWKTASDGEVVVMNRWLESRLPIENIDEKKRTISFEKTSVYGIQEGDAYYVEGVLETLDTPGEWYLNRATGTLYYYPLPEETIDSIRAVAPFLSQVIQCVALVEQGRYVKNIIFKNLVFSHLEWELPPNNSGFAMGSFQVPGAINMIGTHQCSFQKCTFSHIGTYAIHFNRGCANNQVIECKFFDIAGGIKIGEIEIRENKALQTYNNEVSKCLMYNGGHIFHSAMAVWIAQSYNNRILSNHIYDFYNTTIHVGWSWGYDKNLTKDNRIEFNYIHDIGFRSGENFPILNDKGFIHTLGVQPGTVIRYNILHNIQSYNYGGWGIYLDEGSSQILVESNIVYQTRDGGFHQHYGKDNIIRNNIFALGNNAQIRRSAPEGHLSFIFERNIVYWSKGKLLEGRWADFNYSFDYNLYWQVDENNENKVQFHAWPWKQWQQKGMDLHSKIADPLFIAPERGDFRIQPNSPAFKLGFNPIPVEKIISRI